MQDCQEILEVVRSYIKRNSVSLQEGIKLYNTQHSSFIELHTFEKIMVKANIPVSRIELKSLFNFLASGLKGIHTAKYLALADMTRYLSAESSHRTSNAMHSSDLTSDLTLDFSGLSPKNEPVNQNIKIVEAKENDELASNSIIQLEDQITKHHTLQVSELQESRESLRQRSRRAERPQGSKVNALKKRIEDLSKKAKQSAASNFSTIEKSMS